MTNQDGREAGARQRARVNRIPVPTARAIVDCAVYRHGRRVPGRFTHAEALKAVRGPEGGFVWIGMHEPDERQLGDVATEFGLHPLAVEDALVARQRPKLDRYDEVMVVVLRTVAYVEHDKSSVSEIVKTGEILVFVGPDFVVAVRHGSHSQLKTVRANLEADPERLSLGPGAVLHAIADHIVDTYLEVTAAVEEDVEEMEEEVFTPRSRMPVEPIYQLKREIVELRRAVLPLAAPLQALAKADSGLPKEIRHYLRDVADHHTNAAERITDLDDALSSLVNASLTKITVQQNTDMRKISALVAIAAVPTMIAGVYGMNFQHMPELTHVWGYPAVLLAMVVICGGLFVAFRRNGWL
ncbi:magnesium and cobalt transport protein CorA [Nocardia higoensis]|uniref:magnesium and cobalt transport protein CorA n=1 Tax=Nocardia higoensis TaxID=228599 RepID=UPI0002F1906E|nr:magnesium and cobalt transport protein CorA [Nocardia higoensis]